METVVVLPYAASTSRRLILVVQAPPPPPFPVGWVEIAGQIFQEVWQSGRSPLNQTTIETLF